MMKKKHQKNKPVKNHSAGQITAKKININNILLSLGLIILASILFAISFPNPVFKYGLGFFAWFAYIPILIVISKSKLLSCVGWGAVYGFASYFLFNYWLGNFHPLAGILVYSIYMVFMAGVFLLLKLACIFFPKRYYLVQWIIWIAFEYLCTKGFLGYPYGITGYTQWRFIPFIQIASITGVWGISALVTFPSFWFTAAFRDNNIINHRVSQSDGRNTIKPNNLHEPQTAKDMKDKTKLVIIGDTLCNSVVKFFLKEKLPAIIWGAAVVGTLIFGFISMKDFSGYPEVRIALIQHNTDPWEASKAPTNRQKAEAYRKDLAILKRLSDEALASEPKPQLVVWPETAFIPRINWHDKFREVDSQEITSIVRELLDYLSVQDVPFLIGNDDAERNLEKNPNPDEKHRVDYNAAMLFEKRTNTETYRKLHLVPFTEHFPYKKQLPFFYEWLENADTHFWEKGETATVFSLPEFTFSTPICFEDTFGYLSRNFVRNGADVLVNLSNDAWSKSLSAQYQHLSMAVFRAVENHRPMVRATTSGQSCVIDPNGRIIMEAPPFTETWLNAAVPIVSKTTIYTLYGDFIGIFFVLLAVVLLLSGAVWCTIRSKRGAQ